MFLCVVLLAGCTRVDLHLLACCPAAHLQELQQLQQHAAASRLACLVLAAQLLGAAATCLVQLAPLAHQHSPLEVQRLALLLVLLLNLLSASSRAPALAA
jgi:hypothetical protein